MSADAGGASAFTVHSVRGTYAMDISGTLLGVTGVGPLAGTGVLTFDGAGTYEGHETISYGLGPCSFTLHGTYTVAADGTGTGTLTVDTATGGSICTASIDTTVDLSLVATGKGIAKKVKLSETTAGYVILGVGDLQE